MISNAHAQTIPRHWIWLGALVLAVVVTLAYSNTFTVPFLNDDWTSIATNQSIHSWRTVLFPPNATGETVGGRPLLNISLALNYAISGTNVWSYHLVNVLVHIASGLALFGLVRRALLKCGLRNADFGMNEREAFGCALAAAGIWALHPLQTEAVTYIVQRAESMVSLWYLLTLYCFARAAQFSVFSVQFSEKAIAPSATSCGSAQLKTENLKLKTHLWLTASVACCLFGMASKEIMVSAPVLVLLYDRAFVAGTFAEAWRTRRKFYIALAATWLVLAACVAGSGFRGGTTGFGTSVMPVTWWSYAITQCKAILIYVKLVFWPAPLIYDYGVSFITSPWQVLPQIIVVSLLVTGALVSVFMFPRAGWLGVLFFAVLAPSSSFLPIVTQTMAEYRMYLPSAAIVTGVVVACRWFARGRLRMAKASAVAACAVAILLGALTWQHNQAYQSPASLWMDDARKMPHDFHAQYKAGGALISEKRYAEGIPYCLESIRLNPDYGMAYYWVGQGLSGLMRHEEAIPYYQKAVSLLRGGTKPAPLLDLVYFDMSEAMRVTGRQAEARAALEDAVALNPKHAPSLNNLANYEMNAGNYASAEKYYRRAIDADPGFAGAHGGLANALAMQGRDAEARKHYEAALRLMPDFALAHYYYACLLLRLGETEAARAQAREAVRIWPDYAQALELLKAIR